MSDRVTDAIPDAILLDLETDQAGGLLKIGAVRGDRVLLRSGNFDQKAALSALKSFVPSKGKGKTK